MTPIQPDRRRARSFDVFWKHRYGPAFRTIYLLFLASFPTFVANVAVAVWIVFNPAPVEPDGVTASAANVSDTATAIDNSMSMLGNTTAGSQSQEEPPSFSEGIPISINIVLGVCLVFCLILAQRFMLHVLGRGASQVHHMHCSSLFWTTNITLHGHHHANIHTEASKATCPWLAL